MKGGISSVEFLIDCGCESKGVWWKEGQDVWKNDIILIQCLKYPFYGRGIRHGAYYSISNDIVSIEQEDSQEQARKNRKNKNNEGVLWDDMVAFPGRTNPES